MIADDAAVKGHTVRMISGTSDPSDRWPFGLDNNQQQQQQQPTMT